MPIDPKDQSFIDNALCSKGGNQLFVMKMEGNFFDDIFSNQGKIPVHENLLWSLSNKFYFSIFFTKKRENNAIFFLAICAA